MTFHPIEPAQARPRRSLWRVLVHRWAELVLLLILVALVALTGYEMWRAGWPRALDYAPRAALLLGIAMLVAIVRWALKGWLHAGYARLRRGLVREVTQDVAGQAQGVVGRGAAAPVTLAACPTCGRALRPGVHFCDGCGAQLIAACPHCGNKLWPQAHFCDACGRKLGKGGRKATAR